MNLQLEIMRFNELTRIERRQDLLVEVANGKHGDKQMVKNMAARALYESVEKHDKISNMGEDALRSYFAESMLEEL